MYGDKVRGGRTHSHATGTPQPDQAELYWSRVNREGLCGEQYLF
jgi:hypothetical protein